MDRGTETTARLMTRRGLVGGALMGAALATGVAGLAGCSGDGSQQGSVASGSAGSSADAKHQVTIAMGTGNEPAAGFDPCVDWGCGEHVHEPLIQSTLVTTDEQLNIVSDLATEYLCSDDGLVWTFTIRDDVLFTDGEPLTARDVAFTVNGVIQSSASEADLSMVDTAVAVSDTVV